MALLPPSAVATTCRTKTWLTSVLVAVLALVAPLRAEQFGHVHVRGMDMSDVEFGQPPPADSAAQLRLDTSLRLGEFLDVPLADGQSIRTWVVYPLRTSKAPVVLVIHEADGLSDWTRAVADQAAAEGYLAVAPDLVPAPAPTGSRADVDGTGEVARRLAELAPAEIHARLDAVRAFAVKLPNANGKFGIMGFGWGGGVAFGYATHDADLGAAVIYYGQSPEPLALASVKAPIMGLYAEGSNADTRMAAATAAQMKRLKKTFQSRVFKGASGPFLRVQDGGRDGANEVASVEAWLATFSFFRRHLGK